MSYAKALIRHLEIEQGISDRLARGETVRFDSGTVDDQSVVDEMYTIDPDRYISAIREIATQGPQEAEAGVESLRRLWDYALATALQRHCDSIRRQAEREVLHEG